MTEILIGGVLLLTAVCTVSSAFSTRLKLRRYSLESEKISEEITVLHLSDLHESLFGAKQKRLISRVAEEKPDIIVLTGDIIEDDYASQQNGKKLSHDNSARMLLEALAKIAPCYMVFGNHESNIPNVDDVADEVEHLGIRLLHKKRGISEEIRVKGQSILICGAEDPHFDHDGPCRKKSLSERLFEDKNRNTPTIIKWRERLTNEWKGIANDERLTLLLSHRPEEYELYQRLGFDAAFSGHAHGGQWRLPPFINGVYAPHQGFFPRHAGGCYRYNGFYHVVSRGLSKKRMIRIFNRPEICVVKFIAK